MSGALALAAASLKLLERNGRLFELTCACQFRRAKWAVPLIPDLLKLEEMSDTTVSKMTS
jgi:hypothetical protein